MMQNNSFLNTYPYQPQQGLISNPFGTNTGVAQGIKAAMPVVLNLNQIDGFEPVKAFTDCMNTQWQLVKAATDSTVDVPRPDTVQVIDYWVHEFPGIKQKLYVYVVEGIRQPRVETEKPTRFFYQWFSTIGATTFNPQMITEKEWLRANVYAAPMVDARTSKLNAICHIQEQAEQATQAQVEDAPIHVEGISNVRSGSALEGHSGQVQ